MSELAAMKAPEQCAGGTCDADEFQLPVGGLFADLEFGRGSVQLPDDFQHGSSLAKLLVLRDWQRAMQRYRLEALCQFERELCSGQPQLPAAERLGLLRSTCDALRIELPEEFETAATAS